MNLKTSAFDMQVREKIGDKKTIDDVQSVDDLDPFRKRQIDDNMSNSPIRENLN